MEKLLVTVKRPDGTSISKPIQLSGKSNLMAAIRREFTDMKFRIDKKYGAEVVEIGGIKKGEGQGIHFTINGQVPVIIDQETGKKLYLSLYHITATPQNLAGAHLVLELVSASCDFAGSVVDAKLRLRTESFQLEPLEHSSFLLQLPPPAFLPKLPDPQLSLWYFLLFRQKVPFELQKNPNSSLPIVKPVAEEIQITLQGMQLAFLSAAPVQPVQQPQAPSQQQKLKESGALQPAFAAQKARLPAEERAPKQSLPVKAVIFDLDGVIVDSEKAHLETFNAVLKPFGVKISPRFWRKHYTGIGSIKIFQDIAKRHKISANIDDLVKQRAKIYHEYIERHGLPAIAGFGKFYSFLAQNKIKAIVASGGHRKHIAASLSSLGLSSLPFVGLEDVSHPKPNPEIFLLAAAKLKVSPSECLVIEDSLSGLQAAKSAGMRAIALSTTLSARQLKGKANWVFKDYNSKGLWKLLGRLLKRAHPFAFKKASAASSNWRVFS
ncbi:MAG: HAD family phosphatase [Candidatus Micrarchaeota archaeon]|nr:HAD family phosphatase [Candidatus Micrarchaeota archaeon]